MKPSFLVAMCTAIVTLALGSYFLNFPSSRKTDQPDTGQEIGVRFVHPRRVSLAKRIKLSGELRAERQFDLVSRLGGKVTAVHFKVGNFVQAGELMATVEAEGLERRINEQEDGIRTAREDLRGAQTELDAAEKRVAAHRELLRRDLIARRDFEQVENAAETSRARVELARARLAQYEATYAQLVRLRDLSRIEAAVSGQVSRVYVKAGSWIGERSAIATLVDPNELKLVEEVAGNLGSQLSSNQPVQISNPDLPGVIAQGKISRLKPVSDGAVGPYAVEIVLANPRKIFRVGMVVDAWIVMKTREAALLIPRAAIASKDKRTSVFKISADLALRQEVKIGRELDDQVEVIEGLTDRDSVLIEYPQSLRSGTRVRAQSSQGTRRIR